MKKVLLVNKFYPPVVGGIETVVRGYALLLRDLGYEVTVLSAKNGFSLFTDIRREEGIRVVRCSSLGTFFSMPLSLAFVLFFVLEYRRFDYVHFHEPFPLGSLMSVFPFGKSRKIFVTWHSDIVRQKFLKKQVEVLQRLLLRKAHTITATSPRLIDVSGVLGAFADKTVPVPLSIDSSAYRDPGGRLPEGIVPGGYILYLGRLSYYKGIRVLLDAYKASRLSMPLVIAGCGEEGGSVASFMSENPEARIVFVNRFVDEEEKLHFLANCAFFVLPSVYMSEAFAIIQLEAMVFGKPVVNTNLPTGVPWVSQDGLTGITVDPGNPVALAAALRELSLDEALRAHLGENGRRRVGELFDDRIVKERLEALYGGAK